MTPHAHHVVYSLLLREAMDSLGAARRESV